MDSATTNMGTVAPHVISNINLCSTDMLFVARPSRTWGGEEHSDIDEALVVELACAPAR
jgi:hypothetical protein